MLRKTAQTHGSIFDAHLHALKKHFIFFLYRMNILFKIVLVDFFFWIGFFPWILVLNKELWESHWTARESCVTLYMWYQRNKSLFHIFPNLSLYKGGTMRSHHWSWQKKANSSSPKPRVIKEEQWPAFIAG